MPAWATCFGYRGKIDETAVMEEMSREESEHHSFHTFHGLLQRLSLPAVEASNANGNYNTAWETKDGIANHPISYLAESAFLGLSTAQIDSIRTITKMVAALPDEAVSPKNTNTRTLEGDIASLRHPAWDPVRAYAAEVVEILQPVAVRNDTYFKQFRS